MTTPNFKVLVNAVQLGQPSDPAASIRALVEQMLVQQDEIGHLRRELALLQNRLAALTVVAEPEASSSHPRRDPPRSEPAPRHRIPNLAMPEEENERNSTVVIAKAGVEGIESRANAPFPIAPAGRLHRRPDPEIPGAPWASTPAPAARPASGRPPPRERSEEGTWPDEVVLALAQASGDLDVDVTHTTDELARALEAEHPETRRAAEAPSRPPAGRHPSGRPPIAHGDPNDGPPPIPRFVDDDDDLELGPRGREPSR